MEYQMVMGVGNGSSVRGTPGLFYPNDKARIDYLWTHRGDNSVDITFAGDVTGQSFADTLGNRMFYLTVDGLDDFKAKAAEMEQLTERLSELETRLEGLTSTSDVDDRLTEVESRLDGLSEQSGLDDRLTEVESRLDGLTEMNGVDDRLADIESRLDDLSDQSGVGERLTEVESRLDEIADTADFDERLNLFAASLDAFAEDQLAYLKTADFDTVSGAMIFYDGLGAEVFTVGGATAEPYTVAGGE